MRYFLISLFILAFTVKGWSQNVDKKILSNWKNATVLVYTKNGKGYVHDNIPFAVKAIQGLGVKYNFKVEISDNPSVFTPENLKKFSMLIFTSTNNDVFDTEDQKLAFRQYIEGGGGLVGIHSVLGTERNWDWFKKMLGGSFSWHAPFQKFSVQVLAPHHPSVKGVPLVWEREDECYFNKEMFPGIEVVMAHHITTVTNRDEQKFAANAGNYNEYYPAVWYHAYDGGHIWITALGHHKNDYSDVVFMNHIFQGMNFILNQVKKGGGKSPYAIQSDDPLKFEYFEK